MAATNLSGTNLDAEGARAEGEYHGWRESTALIAAMGRSYSSVFSWRHAIVLKSPDNARRKYLRAH
jgi:hypothetical protein